MSHFTVLVLGDNPEKQLAPYHEYECTGEDDEYIQDMDITEEERESYMKDHSPASKKNYRKFDTFKEYVVSYLETPKKGEGDNKWGYYEEDKNGEIIKIINRTNPNAQWDYYRLGGRWNGFFKLKEEYRNEGVVGEKRWDNEEADIMTTDQARKECIEFSDDDKTFAVIKNGEWFEKGKMGWWGCHSATDKESKDWDKSFYNKWIKELPEDTLLSVFDCHI